MATYNLPHHERTDTMDAVGFQLIIANNPVDLTGATVTLTFDKQGTKRRMEIGSGLSFIDAAQGKFQIDEQDIDWDAGTWNHEMQFTFADGRKKTYLKGTFQITD